MASYLVGIAHVVVLDRLASWTLSDRFGKERSTFRGAVRCYNPGFTKGDDPFKHKLWLREAISRSDAVRPNGFLNLCLSHLFAVTTAQFAPYTLLTPTALRRKLQETIPASDSEPTIEAAFIAETVVIDDHTRNLSVSLELITELGAENDALRSRLSAYDGLPVKLEEKTEEIVKLEQQLLEARDETAQRTQELTLFRPYQQEAEDLKFDLAILRGEYETKDAPVLKDFWDGFNMFFEAAKNIAAKFGSLETFETLSEQLKAELESKEDQIGQLKSKLIFKDQRLEAISLQAAKSRPQQILFPGSWSELLETERLGLELLSFSEEIAEQLESCPFVDSIAKQVHQLLIVLNAMALHSDADGSLNAEGLRTHQGNFVGENAAFSDESASNKRAFESKLLFPDPDDPSVKLFCPWHGKINQQQFRVHFQRPRPDHQRKIKIVYIGPKITKH